MPYAIIKTSPYLKDEAKYSKALGTGRIARMESHLQANPKTGANVKKVQGADRLFRYRIANYRIFYLVDDALVTVLMIEIKPRGGAYQK